MPLFYRLICNSLNTNTLYIVECSSITSITIPKGVTNIDSYAISGCSNLKEVYCYAEFVPNTTNDSFVNTHVENVTLHVPKVSVEKYKNTAPWNEFKDIIALTDQELGVGNVSVDNEIIECYQLNGQKFSNPKHGLNIIRTKHRMPKKVMVK